MVSIKLLLMNIFLTLGCKSWEIKNKQFTVRRYLMFVLYCLKIVRIMYPIQVEGPFNLKQKIQGWQFFLIMNWASTHVASRPVDILLKLMIIDQFKYWAQINPKVCFLGRDMSAWPLLCGVTWFIDSGHVTPYRRIESCSVVIFRQKNQTFIRWGFTYCEHYFNYWK